MIEFSQKVVVTNIEDRTRVSGPLAERYLETDIRASVNDVSGQVKETAKDVADEVAFLLKDEIGRKHSFTGALADSIKVTEKGVRYQPGGRTGGVAGGGSYSAKVEVGRGVEHSNYFFQGTGKYQVDEFGNPDVQELIYRARDYGHPVWGNFPGVNPISYANGAGPQFIGTFKGQEDNLKIQRDAQAKARKLVRNRLRNISN
jgi:hypothetical protein